MREHLSEFGQDAQDEFEPAIETLEAQAERSDVDRRALRTTLERVKDILVAGAAAESLLEPVLSMLSAL